MNYLDEAVTKSLDEFMECYKVVDTENIYSIGIEFVPIFRVKQWEEYNDKNKEIERLKKENAILKQTMCDESLLINENALLKDIIKEVREYIKDRTTHYTSYLGKEPKVVPKIELQREAYDKLLEILDKEGE